MNYYAQGGQAHGLKALAQELPKYGRGGDSIVAHINPEEAMMLKAMGGSGTINPVTGLPEYNFLKKAVKTVAKPFQQAASGITQGVKAIQNIPGIKQVSDVATQAFRPIDQALVGLDKTVGKVIPGGWGTVASVAGSAMGLPTPALVGLGGLTGSGVMRKGGSFNLQGALIGGATAYASAKLGDYARAAAPGAGAGPELLAGGDEVISGLGGSTGAAVIPESATPYLFNPPPPPPSIGSQIMAGNFGDAISQVGTNIGDAASRAYTNVGEGITSLGTKAADAYKTAINPATYTDAIESAGTNLSQTGAGIKNLITGPAGVAKTAGTLSGVNPVNMGGMALFGASTLSDLDAQRDFLKQQLTAGNMAQAEYDAAVAEIDRQAGVARDAVARSPFDPNPSRDVSIGETFYGRSGADDTLYGRGSAGTTLYAMGGSIDDEMGFDDSPRGLGIGNMSNGFMNMGSTPAFAKGGMPPRFLSGGGDGMSDDIPAVIGDKQPARLADGEFVIPADVVSHLGNGSSKAGAKQLYSMMDKVRSARTGNSKQGKQINPRKYMPA
jgi:hypothetical protein